MFNVRNSLNFDDENWDLRKHTFLEHVSGEINSEHLALYLCLPSRLFSTERQETACREGDVKCLYKTASETNTGNQRGKPVDRM